MITKFHNINGVFSHGKIIDIFLVKTFTLNLIININDSSLLSNSTFIVTHHLPIKVHFEEFEKDGFGNLACKVTIDEESNEERHKASIAPITTLFEMRTPTMVIAKTVNVWVISLQVKSKF